MIQEYFICKDPIGIVSHIQFLSIPYRMRERELCSRARGIFAENQRSMCLRENRERQMKLDAAKRIKWQWGYHGIG